MPPPPPLLPLLLPQPSPSARVQVSRQQVSDMLCSAGGSNRHACSHTLQCEMKAVVWLHRRTRARSETLPAAHRSLSPAMAQSHSLYACVTAARLLLTNDDCRCCDCWCCLAAAGASTAAGCSCDARSLCSVGRAWSRLGAAPNMRRLCSCCCPACALACSCCICEESGPVCLSGAEADSSHGCRCWCLCNFGTAPTDIEAQAHSSHPKHAQSMLRHCVCHASCPQPPTPCPCKPGRSRAARNARPTAEDTSFR
jgi:hypothetical protein